MAEPKLKGRIAVVTGGGSGIGAGCAAALARDGADVALLVHGNDAATERVRADVVRAGRRAAVAELDVGREDDVARAFDQVARELGVPGILVNAVCPGFVATDFTGRSGSRTAAEGAAVAVRFATLTDGGPTGGFFDDAGAIAW